jgi:hypothetical protein
MEVYIGNLRKGISAKEVLDIFSHMGEIIEVEIIHAPKSDPLGKDFAIVHLVTTEPVIKTSRVSL